MRKYLTENQLRKEKSERRAEMNYRFAVFRDMYPYVKTIVISYRAESASFEGNMVTDQYVIDPSIVYMPVISCPNSTCTGVGFDMSTIISTMVSHRKEDESGEMVCSEWEDLERYGSIHCGSKLLYQIHIEYLETNNSRIND